MSRPAAAHGPVVALGLEMGDGRLIRRWCDEGRLPAIKSLLDRGTWAPLETTAEMLHVSAWPSLYTGTAPGKHGVYFTFQPRPGVQGYVRFQPGTYGEPSFWRLLSESGKRCVVFDAPYTEPEPMSGSVQIFDWGTWAQYLGPSSTPGNAIKDLRRHCGAYPLGLEAHDLGLVGWDPDDMAARLVRSVEAKARAITWLMGRYPWELFFAVFGETHPAAHYCWPPNDAPLDSALQLRRVYEAIDKAIGEIVARAGPNASVFVVSGDGVGPNYSGWHLLPDVLEKLGYFAKAKPVAQPAEGDAGAPRKKNDIVKAVRDLLPKDFRKSLARRLPRKLRDTLARRVDTADIDWSRTRAFCLPTDLEGYVRVNLKGREPQGVVNPDEYVQVCEALAASLRGLRNSATGRPAVRDVLLTAASMAGPRRDQLPDLVVCWADDGPIEAVESELVGTVTGHSPDGRTGTHRPPGFVLAVPSEGAAIEIPEGAHIFDFAPTLLAHFGVRPTERMDGAVWRTV